MKHLKKIALVAGVLLIGACTMPVPRHQTPVLTFAHLEQFTLSADQVLFANEVEAPVLSSFDEPQNEPALAAIRLLHQRYKADNEGTRNIRFTVKEALISEKGDRKKKSFDARLAVTIDIDEPDTGVQRGSVVRVGHESEFDASISLAAQDRVKFRVMETALHHLDTAVQRKIQEMDLLTRR